MSKSSTASSAKNPTIPRSSAWSRGPPLPSSTPPRSQSPAPSHIPVQSHSRRPSALSGVPIKDGVTIPKNNVSAVKQGSAAVTFGSIDDVSAPISSSPPVTASSIKSEGVKSFGTIEADAHVNGKSSLSSRPSAAASTSSTKSTTTSTPAVSVAPHAHPAKLAKTDIAKLFQTPTSAPSSQPSSDTSSPSLRSTNLPSSSQTGSSSQSQSSTPSQPSQLGSHSFTSFVPRPQQQNHAPGAPRSPAWSSRQAANGTGGRAQGGPNGAPSQMNAGMASPRLAPHPHNGQPSNMPPPPQMQPPMPQQMPVAWAPYYPYPGMPEQHYYNPGWYGMSPSPHHPPPGGPHGPPHSGMPISPRNPPMQLQGTPTMSHATASPVHPPHPPPPLSHTSSNMSSISSPPPTPSSATSRLSVKSNTFVPSRPSAARITFRKPDGEVVSDIRSLTHADKHGGPTTGPTAETVTAANGQPPKPRQETPGTPTRPIVRLETEEQHKKRLEEEERAKAEAEQKARKKKEEEERKLKEEEKRKQHEEERKRREEEEKEKERERIRKEEEEKDRIRKEEELKERLRQETEEKQRLRREEEEREKKRIEEEARERIRKEEEEKKERLRQEEQEKQRREEEERQRREEEERQRQELEERKRKEEEDLRVRKEEEERERLRKEEEEKERIRREEEEAAAKARVEAKPPAKAEEEVKKDAGSELEPLEEGEIASSPKEIGEKARETLRINTSDVLSKKRPGRLDLSNTHSVPAPLPSALATARAIDDLGRVSYPEGIQSPKPELNLNAKDGKFRYDRDFLLQFMSLCKEKPDMLPPLDAIGLEPIDQSTLMMTRGGSGRHRQASGNAVPSRSGSMALGGFNAPSGFGKSTGINPFAAGGMGNFSTTGVKLTSEERFQLASGRSASVGGPAAIPFVRPIPMQRTASQGGPGGSLSSNRTRSQRGKQRGDTGKMGGAAQQAAAAAHAANFEPVIPLKVSENRWDRRVLQVDTDSPEMVDRKVRGLLNKLTMERFDSISDQIIEWANKSEKEKDGRTLIQVIRLVFEKATDEATWSEMYARLCRKMMEQISSQVQDDGIRNTEGKPITGGQLFRKYLLNRCQEDFERGWVAKEATAAAAATKAMEDEAVKAANEKNKESGAEDAALYSEEYYAAQKAKRQGLGLIKFIGELFKLQMLTERIMHECIKKLLWNVDNPEEEEIESLCKLLTTVGKILDNQKAHGHMDIYFQRMKELTRSPNVTSRMKFMLQDVIELRERGWVPRNAVAAPSTIAQVHEAASKEKAAQEKEYSQRQISMSRGGSRRGGDRNDHPQANPEGWTTAVRPASKAGDLTNFGKISKAVPTTFGPGSVFAGKKADKRESLSRTSSSSNMFSMLQNAESGADKALEQTQRRKLVLMPRTKPVEQTEPQQQESSEEEESATPVGAGPEMSDESAKKKIEEDSKEFFGIRNLDEAEVYFTTLPANQHHRLVDKLVSTAVELKEADAQLVADLFARAVSKNLCNVTALEEGLAPIAEFIEDIAIDAPKACSLYATMVKGAGLDEERRSRLASKSSDSDKLLALLS